MAFNITQRAREAALKTSVTPQVVLEIEGVSTVYGAIPVKRFPKYGDPGVDYGDSGLVYGGFVIEDDSEDYVSFEAGSSTTIRQTVDIDKGRGSTVTSLQVALIDVNDEITRLITPGEIVTDILGRKAIYWFGFDDTSWPDDFIIIHRGIIDQITSNPEAVLLTISHPDNKKRQTLFEKQDTQLDGAIGAGDTTITVDDTSGFLTPVTGPDATIDTSIKFYIKIDDEVMRYTGTTATTFTTVTRGELGTTAAAHSDNATVESFITLEGNALDLALKLMLSGVNGPWQEDLPATHFEYISSTLSVPNAIFFRNTDLPNRYGVTVGDFITTTGATNGANNVSLKAITDIVDTDDGQYIVVDGVTFVSEQDTSAVVDFRSRYDTLGVGLQMGADEVDIDQHEFVKRSFAPSFDYLLYIKDTIEQGKEFIEEQLYIPFTGFSVNRKSRASVDLHAPPIPTIDTKILTTDNVKMPSKISLNRSLGKNFQNTVIYKFDDLVLEDRRVRGVVTSDATSLSEIPVGARSFIIDSLGMRTDKSAVSLISTASSRRLSRYKRGAESFDLEVMIGDGFNIEIGDVVLLDAAGLKMSDTGDGTRGKAAKLFQVINRVFNIRTGKLTVSLLDTNFDGQSRFAVISASSQIQSGVSTTEFIIEPFYGSGRFGANEFRKWEKYTDPEVRVHNADFSVSGIATISNISGNRITVDTSLGFTPASGYIMQLAAYSTPNTDQVKLLHAWMNDAPFGDGGAIYRMF